MKIFQFAKTFLDKFPRIALALRSIKDVLENSGEPQDTPLGFKLIGNEAMRKGEFEPEETAIVQKVLSSVDVLVNVGANIGYYCCLALSRDKSVIAFEPMPHNVKYLLRNVKANGWESSIEVYPVALSDSAGVIEIFGGGTAASLVKGWAGTSDNYVTLTPCLTLDNVLGDRLKGKKIFMLVDIEGAELAMLNGAPKMLNSEPKPIWLVEISVSEHQPKGIAINPNLVSTFEKFFNNDYDAFTADSNLRKVEIGEIKKIAETGLDTLKTHNFLFIERDKKEEFFND